MREVTEFLSELSFEAFCKGIKPIDQLSVEFILKHSFHKNLTEEVFRVIKTDNSVFFSDNGSTLINLDDVFELGEADVRKNINAILTQFNMCEINHAFVYKVDPSKGIHAQLFRYLQGIHFLYTMKLFYLQEGYE